MSRDEVRRLLTAVSNTKHRALIMLIYCGGLRVGEAVRLKLEDVDPDRDLVRVRAGKGAKDRNTLFAVAAREALADYVREFQPRKWGIPRRAP